MPSSIIEPVPPRLVPRPDEERAMPQSSLASRARLPSPDGPERPRHPFPHPPDATRHHDRAAKDEDGDPAPLHWTEAKERRVAEPGIESDGDPEDDRGEDRPPPPAARQGHAPAMGRSAMMVVRGSVSGRLPGLATPARLERPSEAEPPARSRASARR